MKKPLFIFQRSTYLSGASGAARSYSSGKDLKKTLGAASKIRYELIGFRITASTQVVVKMFETPYEDMMPSEVIPGGTPFHTATVTALRPAPVTVSGPFCHNVEFTIEVSATTGTDSVEWDGTVVATLILEE
jgi:hypothetical protein